MLDVSTDDRLVSPSAERNKAPIADILKQVLPDQDTVLENSSGTGQYVVHFEREMPDLLWQPSERDEPSLQSIGRWMVAENLPNILALLRIDATELPWPAGPASAVVCLNMIHIAPWAAAEGLIQGAESVLGQGGIFSFVVRIDGRASQQQRATSTAVRLIRRSVIRWSAFSFLQVVYSASLLNGLALARCWRCSR